MVEPSDRPFRRLAADAVTTVQAYLNDSPSLTGAQIRCEVADDRIVLRGYVSTYSMKQTARVLAESVAADARIEDRLDVVPIPPKWNQDSDPHR